jgi:hypothetical protein
LAFGFWRPCRIHRTTQGLSASIRMICGQNIMCETSRGLREALDPSGRADNVTLRDGRVRDNAFPFRGKRSLHPGDRAMRLEQCSGRLPAGKRHLRNACIQQLCASIRVICGQNIMCETSHGLREALDPSGRAGNVTLRDGRVRDNAFPFRGKRSLNPGDRAMRLEQCSGRLPAGKRHLRNACIQQLYASIRVICGQNIMCETSRGLRARYAARYFRKSSMPSRSRLSSR